MDLSFTRLSSRFAAFFLFLDAAALVIELHEQRWRLSTVHVLTHHPLKSDLSGAFPTAEPFRVKPAKTKVITPEADEERDSGAAEPMTWIVLAVFLVVSLFAFYLLWAKSVS